MHFNDDEHVINAVKTNNHYELNKWEEDFIESLEDRIGRGIALSTKQRKVLLSIYRKAYF